MIFSWKFEKFLTDFNCFYRRQCQLKCGIKICCKTESLGCCNNFQNLKTWSLWLFIYVLHVRVSTCIFFIMRFAGNPFSALKLDGTMKQQNLQRLWNMQIVLRKVVKQSENGQSHIALPLLWFARPSCFLKCLNYDTCSLQACSLTWEY